MMRTYGRVADINGNLTWQEVDTDANGNDDLVWTTTLAQVLRLQPGEDPRYANYGIPSLFAVRHMVPPDFHMARTQQQFSAYFASILIAKEPSSPGAKSQPSPAYRINIISHNGAILPPITVPTSIPT